METMKRISRPVVAQLTAAFVAMSVGMAVYLFDRQPDGVYLMASWMSLGDQSHSIFGPLGNYLPTFSHIYVFILLTAALAASSLRSALVVCAFWLVIDIAFELGQISFVANKLSELVPSWFSGIPILENTSNYFLSGTFDVLDILSITAGAIAAYLTIYFRIRRTSQDD
ncbi:MAG: hypothetical protein JSU95_06995 [Betaproteobacteria bacterium]|nr:MAG: hypothetical protein JSU95_06995 [Betaproteobacteria bacterium]